MLAYTTAAARRVLTDTAGRWLHDTDQLITAGLRDTAALFRRPPAPAPLTDDARRRAWDHQLVHALIGPDRQAIHLAELRDLMRRDPACHAWTDETFRRWLAAACIPVRQVRVGRIAGRLGVHRTDLDERLLALPYDAIRDACDNPSPTAMTCVDEAVERGVETAVERAYLQDPDHEPAFA